MFFINVSCFLHPLVFPRTLASAKYVPDGSCTASGCSVSAIWLMNYLDKEFGFMFVKIQTGFPFNIQVYINGRELMKSTLEEIGKICCSKKTGKKQSPEVVLLMETVCDGRFLVSGFCNKDISRTILP